MGDDVALGRGDLEGKLSVAKEAQELRDEISELAGAIAETVDSVMAHVRRVERVATEMKRNAESQNLRTWLKDLEKLSSALAVALERYPDASLPPERVASLLSPSSLDRDLRLLVGVASKEYSPPTSEQLAWKQLNELAGSLVAVERADEQFREAETREQHTKRLLARFLKARDKVLSALYDEVAEQFVELYRSIHPLDEGNFSAKLEPREAGLRLDVDFFGRGKCPPHALHSEGHQDSMGLCLYLALTEKLTRGVMDLIILDDVVMSVDSDHRRQLCALLSQMSRHRQFLITTHDKNWAFELRTEHVADGGRIVEFFNWCLETGPLVGAESDLWGAIQEDLSRNEVPIAVLRLRRGLERFCSYACDHGVDLAPRSKLPCSARTFTGQDPQSG